MHLFPLVCSRQRRSDMSERNVDTRRESGLNGNYIPSGRQLPRTPPLTEVKKRLDFCDDDTNKDCENLETDDRHQNKTFEYIAAETKTEPNDHSMLKGMKGYELTPSDLEFIQRMKEEKLIKTMEGALEELQRVLKKEMMAAELVYLSREKAQAELKKFPSCEELTNWVKVVLGTTLPLSEFSDLDTKSLLAMVTKEDVRKVIDEKKIEIARMGKMVENKRKKEAEEKESLEKQIAREQMKIQGLMSQLSDLKSELAQQEEAAKAREMIHDQEAPKIKTEMENVDTSGEVQVKHGAKQRKKAVKFTDELQGAASQSKSTQNKLAGNRTGAKDRADKSASETLTAKQKSGGAAEKPTASGKAARGPQRKVKGGESNPESERAARGQRKPTASGKEARGSQRKVKGGESNPESERAARGQRKPTAASQPRNKGRGRTGEAAAAAVEEEEAGLRRSKRIASRR